MICNHYIHKTDLADLSSFKKIWKFSRQISKYLLPLESGNLQLEQTKFRVLAKFANSLCFPWQGISLDTFRVFPVQWVPWIWHGGGGGGGGGELSCD